ncbi:MAG: protein kinase [Verrucomicrobia bacterium]|nr:protein kinase [Verrucomicrobiota bacterium]
MAMTHVCSECGTAIDSAAEGALCTKCLLALGLQTASAASTPTVKIDAAEPIGFDNSGSTHNAPSGIGTSRSFGDYELLEEIARGGMGIVHKARQKSLDRIVAVKMLLFGARSSQETIQRFRIEAAAAASLQHPHIVAIHEVGFHDGQHFFAMEYVAGCSLSAIVKDGPLAPRRAANYLKAIAEAIQYAHEQGILHRDLKPSNVLIDPFDQPKVTDFGLAKRLETEIELTLSGQLLGSPNYMPPEQAAAKRGAVGKRSDVYALGAILYHLLTGRPPFVAPTVAETLQEVFNTEPVSPRVLNPGVPPDLETICLKCLQKEPEKRYQTAAALAEELQRFLNDEPIFSRPVTRTERAWRWCRRKPVIATLAASLAVVFIVGSVGVLTQWRRATNQSEVNRRQVARLNVLNGVQLMQAGDHFKSLLWFTEALRTDAGHRDREEIHRLRLASVLQQCPRLVQVITHNGQPIASAAFSSTDDRLATVSVEDRTVRVWEVPSGKLVTKSKRLTAVPYLVLFSPDGTRLLVVLSDNTARMFDAATGEPLGEPLPHRLEGVGNSALFPAFDSTGQRLVTQTKTNELQVWHAHTLQPLGQPLRHTNQLERIQFSADGSRLFTGTESSGNFAWATDSGGPLPFPITGLDAVGNFFVGTQGDVALIGGRIRKFTSVSKAESRKPKAETSSEPLVSDDYLQWAAFSPEGARVLTASRDRTARVWDALTGKPLTPPLPHDRAVSRAAFSPDGHRVLTVSDDNLTRVWDADTGEPLTPPIPHATGAGASAFSSSGRYLLTVHPNSYVACLWDLHQEPAPPALLRSGGAGNSVSRSGAFVSQEMNNLLRVRNPIDGHDVTLHPSSMKTIPTQAWFDETGRFIILEGESAKVQIWDPSTGVGLPITPPVPSRYSLDEAGSRKVKLPTIDLPADDLVELAQLLAGSKLDRTGGWTLLDLEELTAAWEKLSAKPTDRIAEFIPLPRTASEGDPKRNEFRAPIQAGSGSSRSSRGNEAHSEKSGVENPQSEMDQSLITSAATSLSLVGAGSAPLTRWHRREATAAEGASEWWAAAFHWRKLAALQTGSPEIAQRLGYALQCDAKANSSASNYRDRRRLIPPRDPRAGARQIDLTAHYTAPRADAFSDARREIGLPVGLQKLGGVTFDVRGEIRLFGRGPDPRRLQLPEQIMGIQVQQRATKLHLLHTEAWADSTEGEEIAALTIHYANGQSQRLPIEHAVHLASDWSGASSETKQAKVAWIGTTALANANQNSIRLFKYTWPNPQPDWEIVSVDLASAKTRASYVLVALTVE